MKNLFSQIPARKSEKLAKTVPINSSASLIVKINSYLSDPKQYDYSTNILEFWHSHECEELKTLAFEIHVIPGSSVASERDCSAAEYTINKRRARLHSEKIKKILYLNRNLKFVKVLEEEEINQ